MKSISRKTTVFILIVPKCFSCSKNAQYTFIEKPQMKTIRFENC